MEDGHVIGFMACRVEECFEWECEFHTVDEACIERYDFGAAVIFVAFFSDEHIEDAFVVDDDDVFPLECNDRATSCAGNLCDSNIGAKEDIRIDVWRFEHFGDGGVGDECKVFWRYSFIDPACICILFEMFKDEAVFVVCNRARECQEFCQSPCSKVACVFCFSWDFGKELYR